MVPYRHPAFRPALRQAIVTPVAPVTTPALTVPSAPSAPLIESLFWTALASAAAWASIRTGMREQGFAKAAGWAGGVAAGLVALTGLAGILAPTAARALPVRWYFV